MIILYFVLELLFCSQAYFITRLAAHVQHVSLCKSYRVTHNI